jgi:polyhydroxybutyrate depolymerase
MRPFFHLFGAALALTALYACSSDETTPATGGPDGSAPNDEDGDAGRGQDGQTPSEPVSKVDTTTKTVDVGGTPRKYVLSVPKSYDAAHAYPLIVALHGDGQDAAGFASTTKLADVTGDDAIVAFTDRSEDLFTPYEQNTDQQLIEATILAVKASYTIDAAKIWGFGYSKGAYQLNEIACKKPGILKAMAIHAGGAPQTRDANENVDCPNAIGLAMFVTHGENDDPGGGEFGAAYWASRAGCQQTRSPSSPPMCEAYDGCEQGKPVVFCVVPGQPHFPLYANAAADSWAWFKTL